MSHSANSNIKLEVDKGFVNYHQKVYDNQEIHDNFSNMLVNSISINQSLNLPSYSKQTKCFAWRYARSSVKVIFGKYCNDQRSINNLNRQEICSNQ